MVLDGAMTGAAFLAYVGHVLVPTLRPGDIVVMDNLLPTSPSPSVSHWGRAESPLKKTTATTSSDLRQATATFTATQYHNYFAAKGMT